MTKEGLGDFEEKPHFDVDRHVHRVVGVMLCCAIAHASRLPLVFIRGNNAVLPSRNSAAISSQ